MKYLKILFIILLCLQAAPRALGQTVNKSFTIDDLLKVRRAGDPQLSPDGRWIAYTITDIDKEANRGTTRIYLIGAEGGEPRLLLPDRRPANSPRWSPDGTRLAFVAPSENVPQIWTVDLKTNEVKRVTNISTGVAGPVWSPDSRWVAFASEVFPDCQSDECNKAKEQRINESKVTAKIADRLLFRHWNAWEDGKRSHIFVAASGGGVARDLTPGDYDAPPFSLGGPDDYAFSPDSKELAFVRNTDKIEAISTNGDVFVIPLNGGDARRITGANLANDLSPAYSPDGRYLAYRAQSRPGFEADRWQLMLYDRAAGRGRSVTESFNGWVDSFTFSSDSRTIYFVSHERGRLPVFSLELATGSIKKVIADGFNDDVKISGDGRFLVFTRQSLAGPVEIFRASSDGKSAARITRTNDSLLAQFNLRPAEDVTWAGAGGVTVHGFLVKPPNFDPAKKWPLLVLIHGGPQSAWNDSWSYRWNPQVFASAGYLVFAPNPRGSVGYGQTFVDEISADWGGRVFADVLAGVAQLASSGFVDRERIGAAGGSYGGYLVNWIEGHNQDPRVRFKALVSHAGVYNLTSMFGATEELWFIEWEFKGTPWSNPEMYNRWSPNLYATSFKTPLLVTHGERDYRVPVSEGLQLFTTLQRQGVESKLLVFPDEGHWILKPQNSKLWYDTVIDWFDKHLKPDGSRQ